MNGRPHTVIGVLPPRVNFPFLQVAYVALAPVAHASRHAATATCSCSAASRAGVTIDQARAELGGDGRAARRHRIPTIRAGACVVRPLRDYFTPEEVKLVTLAALGAVTLVLLIACANVANLLLARATRAVARDVAARGARRRTGAAGAAAADRSARPRPGQRAARHRPDLRRRRAGHRRRARR